jgi:K+-sensing histidine kinase KdpD
VKNARIWVGRYVLAVTAVLVTAAVRLAIDPIFETRPGLEVFVLPVAVAAWAGGPGPGLVATALSAFIGLFAFVHPEGSLAVASVSDLGVTAMFVVGGVVISALAAGLRNGREQAEIHAARAERLQAVATALSGELTAAEAASAVLTEGLHALGAGKGVIGLLDPGGETLSIVAAVGFDQSGWDRFEHFRVDAPYPMSEAVRLGDAIIIDGTTELQARYPALRKDIGPGGTAVAVPLLNESGPIGGLYYRFTDVRGFAANGREYLLALGRLCAAALARVRLHDALAARERQQAAVSRLGQMALTELDLAPLFDATANEVAVVLGVDVVNILERRQDDSLLLVAGIGWPPGLVGSAVFAADDATQARYAIAAAEPLIVRELPAESRFPPPRPLLENGVVSGMTTVIHDQDGPWGVLGAHTRSPRTFTEDDTNFLLSVTTVLGRAIDRRRHFDAEREAQDLNRAFIGIVSHELRTPITTIYGGAKMLARLSPSSPERVSIAGDVEAEADRLYRLTEDLLVLTRLERRDLVVGAEPVLLERVLERVVDSERRRWPSTAISLAVPPDLGLVVGEDNYVEQVVRNLVTNAAKFSPPEAGVEVIADRDESEVRVRVLDRGPGIRGDEGDQLFGLFYRSPTTAQQASGAGIGLFVCDRLMRAMGGRIWGRPRDGGGSEFGFALKPYVEVEELGIGSPGAGEPPSDDGGNRSDNDDGASEGSSNGTSNGSGDGAVSARPLAIPAMATPETAPERA